MRKNKLQKGFIVQKMDKKTMIFDGEESFLYTLNETGSFIFEKLKLGWNEKKIIDAIKDLYAITEYQAEKDVKEFMRELRKRKIIT